ncbi:MAG: RluA family pseudouridine synthase [Candidatus Eisenbacteria bacterium]
MSRSLEHSVTPAEAGQRLDRFLATAQADLSRNRVQALIQEGQAQVNGRAAVASRRLKEGDLVILALPEAVTASHIGPEDLGLDIVFEDEHLLVINKPPGLVVHPGAGISSGTLVHALVHHDPAIVSVGGAVRPGIVHRLDKDTSGLMVVARTSRAYRVLIESMRKRAVRRIYHALAWGDPRSGAGMIKGDIGRDPRSRKRMAVVTRGGKPATTHWKALERYGPATLLEVTLETGRTHQIRVHLAYLRHPVVGDPVYGGRVKKMLSEAPSERNLAGDLLTCLPRQALHAASLEFVHPVSGRDLSFASAWPEDFTAAVERLRAFRGHRPV